MRDEPRVIDPGTSEYPSGLADLEDAPRLFVQGDLGQSPGVAVVGTRRCTRYGVDLAHAFGSTLAKMGWTVVSGLARGIDAAAHRGTLDSSGHAVGVLGSGLDVWYPAENRGLYQRLLDSGGALVSEYPPGTPPDRWRFPARNRLIAAIGSATVVVEAGATGGALITARLSAEMGRPVLAVPGDVDRPASFGSNRLIRDGAFPVLGPEDLLEELSLLLGKPPGRQDADSFALPPTGVSLEDLADHWGLEVREALARLGALEAEGRVRRNGDRIMPA